MSMHMTALAAGFLLDLIFGDPAFLYHPVRLIGNLISLLEKGLRRAFPETEKGELLGGVCLVVLTAGISTAVPWFLLWGAARIHPALAFLLETLFCYQLLATRALKDESMKVYDALKSGDLEKSRYAVSMIVGRDTQNLTEEGVAKAAVETIAENTSDGIIAPMLFLALGGSAAGFFYKAVNTMDSMVGYKNDRYLYFGRAAAKLDDVLNFIPSRVSAYLMILGTVFLPLSTGDAWRIYHRDRRNHASPNSAQTEAVVAGALQVQLAGNAYYFGKLYEKPSIGDPKRPIAFEDIKKTNQLLYVTSFLCILILVVIGMGIGW